jgi:peroxiredoxin Q/BCP
VPRTVPKGPKWQSPFPPGPGVKAPEFTLRRDGGGSVYPRADTTGCTREALDFSRLKGAFARLGTEIVGISADSVAALDPFKSKYKLTIALVSDETRKALEAYGAWQQKSLHGRKFMGAVRATFLIGLDQRIARVWPRVSVAGPLKFAAIAKH